MSMIFEFNNDDKGLDVYPSEKEAIDACEGIDVVESPCDFWNNKGLKYEIESRKLKPIEAY